VDKHINATSSEKAPEVLKLLADDTRWQLVALLRQGDFQVGELVSRLGVSQNLISYHLGTLRQAGLVQQHRSDADGRAVYYGLNLSSLTGLHAQIGALLQMPATESDPSLPHQTVFFLCTANSARSQMAEAWLRLRSGGRLTVRSAGTMPQEVHPLAQQVMHEAGVEIGYQRAKGIDALANLHPDLIITVCDIAREDCSAWGADVPQVHWSIADPVAVDGTDAARLVAFRAARDELRQRVEGLIPILPLLTRQG
jgi:protein-tyrosine-phosphatase/DNA-binding transcriptional ArsR family regulator